MSGELAGNATRCMAHPQSRYKKLDKFPLTGVKAGRNEALGGFGFFDKSPVTIKTSEVLATVKTIPDAGVAEGAAAAVAADFIGIIRDFNGFVGPERRIRS